MSRYQIYTSAYATACYLKSLGFDEITETERREHGNGAGDFSKKSVYVIGESGVLRELEEAEIDVEAGVYDSVKCTPSDWEEMQEWMEEDESVGAVVVGSDSKFTFAKLAYASLMIQRGAIFVATNPDAGDLLGPGLYPGAGALAAPWRRRRVSNRRCIAASRRLYAQPSQRTRRGGSVQNARRRR